MATTPWVTPNTSWASGNVVGAADLNNVESDLALLGTPPGCILSNTSAQPIGNGSTTGVTWATVTRDTDGFWAVGNPTRATVPANLGGLYDVTGAVSWAHNSTGYRALFVRVNGSIVEQLAKNTNPDGTDDTQTQRGTTQLILNAADYVEIACFQNSGGSLNIQGTNINAYTCARLNLTWRGTA